MPTDATGFCIGSVGGRQHRRICWSRAATGRGYEDPKWQDVPDWYTELAGDPVGKVWLTNSITRLSAFGDEAWESHKGADRYFRHMLSSVTSSMIQRLGGVLIMLTVISVFALALGSPQLGGVQLPKFEIDPFNLSATALGLLLTLRVSESYNRFRLAHQHLASISGRLRDSARCVVAGLRQFPERDAAAESCCTYLLAVAEAIKCQVRPAGMEDLKSCLETIGLSEEAAARVASAMHPPSAVMSEVTTAVARLERRGLMDAGLAALFQQNIGDVVNHVALCERIKRHPIPLKYTRHTSRVMISWLAFLPLGFVPILGVATVPTVVALGFCLLGIEDIAVQIEEPFTIIDIEDINNDLKRAVVELRSTPHAVLTQPLALCLPTWRCNLRGMLRRVVAKLRRRDPERVDDLTSGFEVFSGIKSV